MGELSQIYDRQRSLGLSLCPYKGFSLTKTQRRLGKMKKGGLAIKSFLFALIYLGFPISIFILMVFYWFVADCVDLQGEEGGIK